MKNSRIRPILAACLAAAVIAPVGAIPAQAEDGVLLHYDFDSAGEVKDVSGNGADGKLQGTGAEVANGVLTLPGGGSGSGAGYVEMPEGLIDGQKTLTINTWLKNQTGSGNYAALFFGSAATPPDQYFLLNPANPDGRFKSVVTATRDTSAPWTTEAGLSPTTAAQGIPGPVTDDGWAMYTTVIESGQLTSYYNGEPVGTVNTGANISEFDNDLVGYIGRSSYDDIFFTGQVDDVLVTSEAITAEDVAQQYYDNDLSEAAVQERLQADADKLTVPEQAISDVTLPSSGSNGSTIEWQSSHPEALAIDGTVHRPSAGQDDVEVTLKATLSIGGRTLSRELTVTVLAEDPERDLANAAAGFDLGITVVTEDITLPEQTRDGAADISWTIEPSGIIADDGTVTIPESDADVTLRADFSNPDAAEAVTRDFEVRVLAVDGGEIAAYVGDEGTPRTAVLHLAHSAGGGSYEALNNNTGVLYPEFGTGTSTFGAPFIFRHPDGTFGFVATDGGRSSSIFVYDSEDLAIYTDARYVSTNSEGIDVADIHVRYDNGLGAYEVLIADSSGQVYSMVTADFDSFSAPEQTDEELPSEPVAGLPEGAAEASTVAMTASEYQTVVNRLGRITNTAISGFEDVTVTVGEEPELPARVDLDYSDGSTKKLGVEWDVDSVDLDTPGQYEVIGEVQQPVYGDDDGVLVSERADPWVLRDDERTGDTEYYLTGSYPTTRESPGVGYDRLVLRRADTINGLTDAEEETILWANNAAEPDTSNGAAISEEHYRYFWAPELHKIDGDWYVLFTSGTLPNDVWSIRPAIIKCDGSGDPMDPGCWEDLGYMQAASGDSEAFAHFSLDMTYFEADGEHYLVWAEKPGTSDLRMATIDPANPQQLTSKSIRLSTPDFAWERNGGTIINEGPAAIVDDDTVFVFFSGSSVDENYSIGVLTAPLGSDLMDLESWTKLGYPLLTTEDFDGAQMGPGHDSFTLDSNDNPVIVYHARPPRSEWIPGADGGLDDPSRHARVKTVHFNADGLAILNQAAEEELAPEFRTVTLGINVVSDEPTDPAPTDSDETGGTDGTGGTDETDGTSGADGTGETGGDESNQAAGSDNGPAPGGADGNLANTGISGVWPMLAAAMLATIVGLAGLYTRRRMRV